MCARWDVGTTSITRVQRLTESFQNHDCRTVSPPSAIKIAAAAPHAQLATGRLEGSQTAVAPVGEVLARYVLLTQSPLDASVVSLARAVPPPASPAGKTVFQT